MNWKSELIQSIQSRQELSSELLAEARLASILDANQQNVFHVVCAVGNKNAMTQLLERMEVAETLRLLRETDELEITPLAVALRNGQIPLFLELMTFITNQSTDMTRSFTPAFYERLAKEALVINDMTQFKAVMDKLGDVNYLSVFKTFISLWVQNSSGLIQNYESVIIGKLNFFSVKLPRDVFEWNLGSTCMLNYFDLRMANTRGDTRSYPRTLLLHAILEDKTQVATHILMNCGVGAMYKFQVSSLTAPVLDGCIEFLLNKIENNEPLTLSQQHFAVFHKKNLYAALRRKHPSNIALLEQGLDISTELGKIIWQHRNSADLPESYGPAKDNPTRTAEALKTYILQLTVLQQFGRSELPNALNPSQRKAIFTEEIYKRLIDGIKLTREQRYYAVILKPELYALLTKEYGNADGIDILKKAYDHTSPFGDILWQHRFDRAEELPSKDRPTSTAIKLSKLIDKIEFASEKKEGSLMQRVNTMFGGRTTLETLNDDSSDDGYNRNSLTAPGLGGSDD